MSKIFYYGSDNKINGPVTELAAQGWYVGGYFSSDIKFHEMESLRKLCSESIDTCHSEYEKKMVLLRDQIELLVETQTEHVRQLKELSSKKDFSASILQIEKKACELKKRMDEQDKNIASMKKEISAVNSKCDRNNSKLEKLLEKLTTAEETVNGCGKRITDLKNAENSMRVNLSTCEQNVVSNSAQLKSLQSDLNEVKHEMMKETELSCTGRAELASIKNNLDALCDATKKHGNQPKAAGVVPELGEQEEKDNDKSPPWEVGNEKEERNVTMHAKIEKVVVDSKPASRAKDWDAICRDLNDDEDEPEEAPKPPKRSADNFVRDYVSLLRAYCEALSTSTFESRKPGNFQIYQIDKYLATMVDRASSLYRTVRDALKMELKSLTSMTLLCGACANFTITSPRHLLYHFTDGEHTLTPRNMPPHLLQSFREMTRVVANVLHDFIASPSEIDAATAREDRLFEKGQKQAFLPKNKSKSIHRPTPQFAAGLTSVGGVLHSVFPNGLEGMAKKDGRSIAIEWFSKKENCILLNSTMEKHLAEGIPFCPICKVAYTTNDEYYRHVTTYVHAMHDRTLFAVIMRLWKGHKYWDANLH